MDCFSLYELGRARQPWADARTQGAAVPVPGPLRLLYKRSGLARCEAPRLVLRLLSQRTRYRALQGPKAEGLLRSLTRFVTGNRVALHANGGPI